MLTSTRPDSRLTAGLAAVFYRYVCDVNDVSCVCLEICLQRTVETHAIANDSEKNTPNDGRDVLASAGRDITRVSSK